MISASFPIKADWEAFAAAQGYVQDTASPIYWRKPRSLAVAMQNFHFVDGVDEDGNPLPPIMKPQWNVDFTKVDGTTLAALKDYIVTPSDKYKKHGFA